MLSQETAAFLERKRAEVYTCLQKAAWKILRFVASSEESEVYAEPNEPLQRREVFAPVAIFEKRDGAGSDF